MAEDLRITVLAERANLPEEHGGAFWIEADGHHILFDLYMHPVALTLPN